MKTRKIVVNRCFGGFGLSRRAVEMLANLGNEEAIKELKSGNKVYGFLRDTPRDDPSLVKVVEKLGEEANGDFAELKIVEIPANVKWEIEDYDGSEHIAETHRTW